MHRLGDTYASDPSTRIDKQHQKQWYASGEGFDQVRYWIVHSTVQITLSARVLTNEVLSQLCARQFRGDLDSLHDGSLTQRGWDTPYDRLALIILADQLSRCCCKKAKALSVVGACCVVT